MMRIVDKKERKKGGGGPRIHFTFPETGEKKRRVLNARPCLAAPDLCT